MLSILIKSFDSDFKIKAKITNFFGLEEKIFNKSIDQKT